MVLEVERGDQLEDIQETLQLSHKCLGGAVATLAGATPAAGATTHRESGEAKHHLRLLNHQAISFLVQSKVCLHSPSSSMY